MSQCDLNHSQDEVLKKLKEQTPFLPEALSAQIRNFLQEERDQTILNETFHLLKKYDLATQAERESRQRKLKDLLQF